MKKNIFKTFGWHFMAAELAKYCNCTFFDIMERPAIEVAGLAAIVHYQSIYNQQQTTNNG